MKGGAEPPKQPLSNGYKKVGYAPGRWMAGVFVNGSLSIWGATIDGVTYINDYDDTGAKQAQRLSVDVVNQFWIPKLSKYSNYESWSQVVFETSPIDLSTYEEI